MTDTIRITLDDQQAQAAFAALIERLRDLSPLTKKWAGHLADASEEAFAREASPDGIPWVDLSDRTKKARSKRGKWPGQKLQVSGHLARSVTPDHGPDFAEIGSNVIYARIQQKGGQAGRGHKVTIPPRPFLGLSDEALGAIQADTVAWIDLHKP